MKRRKRIATRIYSEDGNISVNDNLEDYDDEDYLYGLSLEEAEEMGIISMPKVTKIIDGERDAFNALKNGEDW